MNRVLAHTGARYPIIQAPMGWIARAQLASAVRDAGGMGIIETSSGETENCMAEIEKMQENCARCAEIPWDVLGLVGEAACRDKRDHAGPLCRPIAAEEQ